MLLGWESNRERANAGDYTGTKQGVSLEKGVSGNPSGQSRFYHEARKLARRAAPQVMQELIDLALHADDERVRSVCAVAVLDRAGVRPIDFDPAEEVDEVRTWKEMQPTDIDVMRAGGAVPLGYGDMARAYPQLFVSAEAARKSLERGDDVAIDRENLGQTAACENENPGQTSIKERLKRRLSGVFGFSAVGYRRVGSRGPAGELFFDASRIDPLRWLNQHLGEVLLTGSLAPPAGLGGAEDNLGPAGSHAPPALVGVSAPLLFPRGFAWLASRLDRLDLLVGQAIEPDDLFPPVFPTGFVMHAVQACR